MRLLLVHPSALMYSEILLRLEPLGLERVAAAAREAGHEVRAVDLQVLRGRDLERTVAEFRPEAVGFSLNYLANIPFDIQHAVVPTTLPLAESYRELVRTQAVINAKHLGWRTALGAARLLGGRLLRGRTNFARMLWKFDRVHNPPAAVRRPPASRLLRAAPPPACRRRRPAPAPHPHPAGRTRHGNLSGRSAE